MEIPLKIYTKSSDDVIAKLFKGKKNEGIELDGVKIKFKGLGIEESFEQEAFSTIVKIVIDVIEPHELEVKALLISVSANYIFKALEKLRIGIGKKKEPINEEILRKIIQEEFEKSKKKKQKHDFLRLEWKYFKKWFYDWSGNKIPYDLYPFV